MTSETAKIRIKGLKISGELCLVRLRKQHPVNGLLPAFCGLLAGSQINMPFLATENRTAGIQAAGCVEAAHLALVKRLIDADPALSEHVNYTPGVGLLTLFPHQSSLKMFGLSLRTLVKAQLRIFTLASSIGALTYVLDYARMDKAAAVLQKRFKLADNHAPFRAEFVVSQGTRSRSGPPE